MFYNEYSTASVESQAESVKGCSEQCHVSCSYSFIPLHQETHWMPPLSGRFFFFQFLINLHTVSIIKKSFAFYPMC